MNMGTNLIESIVGIIFGLAIVIVDICTGASLASTILGAIIFCFCTFTLIISIKEIIKTRKTKNIHEMAPDLRLDK